MKFTKEEIEKADNYLNSLGRNDIYPARQAIGAAFVEGMRIASDIITKLESENNELKSVCLNVANKLPNMAVEFRILGMGNHYRNCVDIINQIEKVSNK